MILPDREHLRPYNDKSELFDPSGRLVDGPLKVNDPRTDHPFNGWVNTSPTELNNTATENTDKLLNVQ